MAACIAWQPRLNAMPDTAAHGRRCSTRRWCTRSWRGPPPRRGRSGGWRLLRAAMAPSPCMTQTRLLSTPPAGAGDGRSNC